MAANVRGKAEPTQQAEKGRKAEDEPFSGLYTLSPTSYSGYLEVTEGVISGRGTIDSDSIVWLGYSEDWEKGTLLNTSTRLYAKINDIGGNFQLITSSSPGSKKTLFTLRQQGNNRIVFENVKYPSQYIGVDPRTGNGVSVSTSAGEEAPFVATRTSESVNPREKDHVTVIAKLNGKAIRVLSDGSVVLTDNEKDPRAVFNLEYSNPAKTSYVLHNLSSDRYLTANKDGTVSAGSKVRESDFSIFKTVDTPFSFSFLSVVFFTFLGVAREGDHLEMVNDPTSSMGAGLFTFEEFQRGQ